jgi:hypothetical protein
MMQTYLCIDDSLMRESSPNFRNCGGFILKLPTHLNQKEEVKEIDERQQRRCDSRINDIGFVFGGLHEAKASQYDIV